MTKKQARERKAAWALALAECRVVRYVTSIYPEVSMLTSYPTIAMRDEAMSKFNGPCEIISQHKIDIAA